MNLQIKEYFSKYFLEEEELLKILNLSLTAFKNMQATGCIPQHSYEISLGSTIRSTIFGSISMDSCKIQKFYPKCFVEVTKNALTFISIDPETAPLRLRNKFIEEIRTAMKTHHFYKYQNSPIMLSDEEFDEVRFNSYVDEEWRYWLEGTYGVCTVNPINGERIILKTIALLWLTQLTHNGTENNYEELKKALKFFDDHVMPFSFYDYPLSSRKRLFEKAFATAYGNKN